MDSFAKDDGYIKSSVDLYACMPNFYIKTRSQSTNSHIWIEYNA